jgi:Cu(I)/Ag(I) efflux system membrane fusion protein
MARVRFFNWRITVINPFPRFLCRAFLSLSILLLSACSGDDSRAPSESLAAAADDTRSEHLAKHLDPKYVCPMHPQIVKDEPGSCPICGMDLVEKFIEPDASASISTLPSIAPPSESMAAAAADTPAEHAAKHDDPLYVCPMHPQIVKHEPGNCPICGMNLVPKKVEAAGKDYPMVTIKHAVIQSMGVRKQRVRIGELHTRINTVGRIEYDETLLAHVHPRAAGWMEKLHFGAEGDPVKKGQVLGELYSPDILSAQVDYLIALDQSSGPRMEKARNRLRLFGVNEDTIRQIEKSKETRNRVPLLAPSSGVMTLLTAREGMYVKPEMEIFTIADLSRVWVLVDVFEHQIDWLKPGLNAAIRVPAYPGRAWQGKVEYIYPELDPDSRTLRVRLSFANPDNRLKANMFAEVEIFSSPKEHALMVPAEAIIETGERSSVVKVLGDGRFQPVDVVTGLQSNDEVEILSGLGADDEVVISGQFLIDSESSLKASFLRMTEGH